MYQLDTEAKPQIGCDQFFVNQQQIKEPFIYVFLTRLKFSTFSAQNISS